MKTLALALVASLVTSAASAEYLVSKTIGDTTITYRAGTPDSVIRARAARIGDGDSWDGREGSARDRAWVTACQPRIVTGRDGINRATYAKPGCEFGDAPR